MSDLCVITYEFPYNERIRTLLRIENLVLRCLHFTASDDAKDHLAALSLLFELTDVVGRLELKRDIMQDLERVRQHFARFRENPDIAVDSLEELLAQINEICLGLQTLSGPLGHHIRSNEWLSSIRKRSALPGGICGFDLPSYHYWASLGSDCRRNDLEEWLAPYMQIQEAVSLILKLTRESVVPVSCVAHEGLFQQSGGMSKRAQMLRIHLSGTLPYVPEVMANKHLLQIRFFQPDFYAVHAKSHQATEDIPFTVSICTL